VNVSSVAAARRTTTLNFYVRRAAATLET